MESLSNIVIPASLINLNLLSYLFILGKIIFLGYSGVLFFVSYYTLYGKKEINNYKTTLLKVAAQNHATPYGLGVLPLFSTILIAYIFMHNFQKELSAYLFLSFIIYFMGVILFSLHKISIDRNNNDRTWGNMSLLLQFIGVLIFSVISSGMEFRDNWYKASSFLNISITLNSIVDLLQYLFLSYSISNVLILNKIDLDNLSNEYADKTKKNIILALVITLLLFNFNYFVINNIGYTSLSFVYGLIAIIALIFQIFFLNIDSKRNLPNKATYTISLSIILLIFTNLSNHSFIAYAGEKQIQKLASVYDKKVDEYNLAHTKVEINGGEIYQAKCMACHKFDQKLVGPPHKDVMIKYAGKQEAMIQFILKPVKVDPAYPDMPQQGLTPAEAKAVVEYMYKEYGEKLNK